MNEVGHFIEENNLTIAPLWKRLIAFIVDLSIVLLLALIPAINFGLMMGYTVSRDSWKYFGGKSLGKRVVNIKVISLSFKNDILENYSIDISRNLFSILLPIEILFVIFDKHHRRIGDRYAKTIVVNDDRKLKDYLKDKIRNNKRYLTIHDFYERHKLD